MLQAQETRATPPYGNCIDSLDGYANFYTGYNYSTNYCISSCSQQQYINNCSCATPFYHKPSNVCGRERAKSDDRLIEQLLVGQLVYNR